MAGPHDYSAGTRAALAMLSRGSCYFPECRRPIMAFIGTEPYIDYQIAHIRDAKPGNRYVGDMTDDERRDFSNLILLCKPHHELVDQRHPDDYSIEMLEAWKVDHEAGGAEALREIGPIADEDLEVELRVASIAIENSTINLGGTGGSAPGAGGGGGGVLGDGTGGPGGPGGDRINLDGTPGTAPGAGGGGGGAEGPDEFGGEGGGGGEYVTGTLEVEEGDVLRWHVPEGGKPGQPADDAYLEHIGKDGVAREVMRAKGGKAGRSGIALRDERDGPSVRINSLFFFEAARIKDGTLDVWGGGWDHVSYDEFPVDLIVPIALIAEVVVEGPRETELALHLIDPDGNVRASDVRPLTYEKHPLPHRICLSHVFEKQTVSTPGVWSVAVISAGRALATCDLRIELRDSIQAGERSGQSTDT